MIRAYVQVAGGFRLAGGPAWGCRAHHSVPRWAVGDRRFGGRGRAAGSVLVSTAGVSHQERNWFWYRRRFHVDTLRSVAILRINKAQFGAAVWLNGGKVGEHLPCFSAAIIDVSGKLRPGENEIVIRVGAHPGVLPASVSAGTDFEKNRWTPGIYDSVSLALSGE